MEYEHEQLAVFVANMQLLVDYSCAKENIKNTIGMYCGSKDRTVSGKLSRICHESPAGIKEDAILHKITDYLCCETVYKNLVNVIKNIRCFFNFFVVYANHQNICNENF